MNRRAVAVVAGVALLAIVGLAGAFWWTTHRVARELTSSQEVAVDLGDLVTHVREMSRLETTAMHVMNVSTITQSYKYVPKSLGDDEITLYSEGDVIAGIDLSRVQQGDVWREPDGTLVMRLPPPMILVTRVDNAKTRVVHRNTGFLRRADSGLESRVRLYAEGNIRSEALRKGILDTAARSGEQKLAAFIHTLGVQRVRFVRSEPGTSPR